MLKLRNGDSPTKVFSKSYKGIAFYRYLHTFMILDFTQKINMYETNILNNYREIFDYTCPKCGANHCFTRHGSYSRSVCVLGNSSDISEIRLTILRVKCTSCNSTHAVLPVDVIPYKIYSLSCIVFLLTQHFVSGRSILDICAEFNISFQLMYLFIHYFLTFITPAMLCLKVIFDVIASDNTVALSAISSIGVIKFSIKFFSWAKTPFLMIKFRNLLSKSIFVGAYFSPPT